MDYLLMYEIFIKSIKALSLKKCYDIIVEVKYYGNIY